MSATAESNVATGVVEVVSLESLLTPIAGDNPAGENLRYAGLHDEIREARRADDQLAQGEWRRENKLADWVRVAELAGEALATRSKDLRVAAWYAEALVKMQGLAGLRDGLHLMRALQQNFWESLYPEIDEGDLDARANSLAWLDQQLALALTQVALTDGAGGLSFTFSDWKDSQSFEIPADIENLDSTEKERLSEVRAQAAAEGKITSEQWRAAKNTTGRQFYENTFVLLNDCVAEWSALDGVMDEKFGKTQTPGLRLLQKALEDVRALVENIVREKRRLEPDAVAQEAAGGDETGLDADGNGQPNASSAIKLRASTGREVASRQEAYQKLAEAAAYFREAEPHSPVSYLVERAIKWGQMPLESWLAEVVKSEDVLLTLRETLGIKNASNDYPDSPSGDDES